MNIKRLSLCLILCLLGCERHASVPTTIQGLYTLDPKKGYFAGCTIRLGDGVFAEDMFTDVVTDAPPEKRNPLCGNFVLSGSDITLKFSDGHTDHYILTNGARGFMLLDPFEYEKYLKNHEVPDGVLYQQKH